MIRTVRLDDASAICEIYNYYVANTIISFEYEAVSVATMQSRISNTIATHPWLVYEEEGKIIGYAYATQWKTRKAYKHVLEVTVYSAHDKITKGVGSQLYQALFDHIANNQAHTKVKALMAVIALPNEASIGIHKKMGFVEAGLFKQVGYKNDRWIDVAYYQKELF